jgi:hypothetical protein
MKLLMKALRPNLTAVAMTGLVLLYSCSEDTIVKVDPPVPPPPRSNLPDHLCKPDFSYGYTNRTSYAPGQTVTAYLKGNAQVPECALVIYNIKGDSTFAVAASLAPQTISTNDPSRNGYGFTPSVAFKIPNDLASGVYLIENSIPFVVKPTKPVDILVVYPSNTVNAYATSGGKSLYTTDKPMEVSFHRPMTLQNFSTYCLDWLFSFPGVTVGYIADIDLDDFATMSNGEVLCLVGHNEYWTRKGRENFDQYIASGRHAVVLSGNTMWWQVRYSDDEDQSKMICYKSLDDPMENPLFKTWLWNDPTLQYPIISSIGADFDNGGYGLKADNGWNGYKIVNENSPLLEGTGLDNGDIIKCPTTEYDGAPIASWVNGSPILDTEKLGAHKAELVGFDYGYRVKETVGTFFVIQPTMTSGIIVNVGSTDWCSSSGMGGASGGDIKKITTNALLKLLNEQAVFSE